MIRLKSVLFAIAITLLAFSSASAKETIKKVSWMLVDKTGKQLDIKSKYFPVGHFSEGLIVCTKQSEHSFKFGYMDKNGNVIVEPRYSRARPFSCGVGIVEDKIQMNWGVGEYSLVDNSGKLIKHFAREEVEKISDFSEGIAIIKRPHPGYTPRDIAEPGSESEPPIPDFFYEKGRWGFCDTKGKLTFFENYGELHPFSEGLSLVKINRKFGYVDASGKLVIEPIYPWADSFSQGLAAVGLKGKTGFIDKSGKMVFELKFDRVGSFSEGLAPFQTGGKWGFVDTKGKVVIEPQYAVVADSFHGGIAACAIQQSKLQNTRMEFSQGEFQDTPYSNEHETKDLDVPLEVGDFFRPLLRFGLIDKTGKFVVDPIYWNIGVESDGLRMVITTTGGHGFINRAGKEVIEAKYQVAGKYADGVAVVSMMRLPSSEDRVVDVSQHTPYQPTRIVSHTPMRFIDPELIEANLAACKAACDAEPNNHNLLRQLAWYYCALKRNKESLYTYKNAIALAPKNADLRLERAEVYLRLTQWKDAENDATESIELMKGPDEHGMYGAPSRQYFVRGEARLRSGNFEGAKKDLLDDGCNGQLKNGKFSSDRDVPNNCNIVIETIERMKEYDTAAKLWDGLYRSQFSTMTLIEYPPTLPQLYDQYQQIVLDLEKVAKSHHTHPYLKARKSWLAAELLAKIILIEQARYRFSNAEKKLLRLVELRQNVLVPIPAKKFEDKSDSPGILILTPEYHIATEKRLDWSRAKYWLMKYYAEQRDKRCEQIYKELMVDEIDAANWRCTASAVYANYLFDAGRVDDAEKILKFGMEKYPNMQIVRAQYKFLNSQGKTEQAKKLLDDFTTSSSVQSGNYLDSAPVPEEDCDAEGFLELAKTCKDMGRFNTCLFYLKKAERVAIDEKSKTEIAKFKKHFMTVSEKISSDTEVLFQRVFVVKPMDYLDASELTLCVLCLEKDRHFVPAYLRSLQILREEGTYKTALELVSSLAEKLPDSIDVLIEKARLHACLKETKEAKATYEKILSIDPENSAALRELGLL